MSKPKGFHVRHDLQPHFTYEMLLLLNAFPDGITEEVLRQIADEQGYSLRQRKDYGKLVNSLEDLDVIQKKHHVIYLSEQGRIIADLSLYQRQLLPELIHFLYYIAWDRDANKRFSWSYRTVSDWLWMTAPCTINRDRLVNMVMQNASEQFDERSISFSLQSVMGILNWLNSLDPPCTDASGQTFSRRPYCPVEMFMLALQHFYDRHRNGSSSIPITPEFRQEVCRTTLIAPEGFEEMLGQAETSFDCIQVRRERGERLAILGSAWEMLKA